MRRPRTLAQQTALGPWGHGASDEAACEDCPWEAGPDRARVVLYAARRHAAATSHTVVNYRAWSRLILAREVVP